MEFFQEALASRDLVAWVILILLIVVVVKILKSLGVGLVLLLLIIGIGYILAQFFPDFIQPLVDYVGGGWLGD